LNGPRPPRDRSRDPRDRITPDAFSVHPDLLGLPLAGHGRRIVAILVDLVIIAVLSNAGGVVLGILAAAFFFRVAMGRKEGQPASVSGTAFRGSVGCLGAFILFVTIVSTWGLFQGLVRPSTPDVQVAGNGPVVVAPGLTDLIGGFQEVQSLRRATEGDEAREAAIALSRRLRQMDLGEDDIREFLTEMAPERAAWRDSIREWALAEPAADPVPQEPAPPEAGLPGELSPDTLPLVQALEMYAELLDEMGDDALEGEAGLALRTWIAGALAGDTIAALEARLSRETRDRMRAERALVAQERDRDPGLRSWLRALAEDFGLGLGWAALYFTVFLSWWRGFTPGKRLLRLRVVRLDGQPITWWTALQRYGGYAAGFATGLLGFAQVYWDPNRQATHDKLAETVVIRHGAAPLPVHDQELM